MNAMNNCVKLNGYMYETVRETDDATVDNLLNMINDNLDEFDNAFKMAYYSTLVNMRAGSVKAWLVTYSLVDCDCDGEDYDYEVLATTEEDARAEFYSWVVGAGGLEDSNVEVHCVRVLDYTDLATETKELINN